MWSNRRKLAVGTVVVGAALAVLSIGTIFAQETPERSPLHDQMHEMMDAMHGEGFTERMHESMPGSEEMMEQCAQMMGMMQGMSGMEGMQGMRGMMGGQGMGPRTAD